MDITLIIAILVIIFFTYIAMQIEKKIFPRFKWWRKLCETDYDKTMKKLKVSNNDKK